MGSNGEFDIAPLPRNEGEGGFGLTSGGEFMICGNCCGQEPVPANACACGPCCFSNQSRIRITWQLIDYGNEQDRCCCTDPAFMGNTIEIPFSCGAWNPPYCPGCGHSGMIGGHPQPNCESNTITGPRWQGYGIELPGATCSSYVNAMVIAGCDGDGTTRWYVTVDGYANEDSEDTCGRIFAACIPSAPGTCRSASILSDELHNHSICTNVWDVYANPARVQLQIEVLDETSCMDEEGNCIVGDSNGDGSCSDPTPGI